jgi:hypothetical protein
VLGDRPMKAANDRTMFGEGREVCPLGIRHDVADIIAAGVLIETAQGHVFDLARPQWADGLK